MRPAGRAPSAASARGALLLAALTLVLVERYVPHGRVVLYPFVLFATWVHEMGHGLAALVMGGAFSRLDVYADASGLAHIQVPRGPASGVTAVAGLLAPPVLGGLMLAVARGPRRARALLVTLAAALAASLALWIRGPVGMAVAAGVALVFAVSSRVSSDRVAMVIAQLLGLLLGLDALRRADYLFTPSARIGGVVMASDVKARWRPRGGLVTA
ncbi:MAG: M50 family metallopeptidase [Polyangiales bacterium]